MPEPQFPNREQDRDEDRGRTALGAERYIMLPRKTREVFEGLHDDDLDNFVAWLSVMRTEGNLENLKKLTVLIRQKGMPSIERGVAMADAAQTMGRWSWRITAAACGLFVSIAGLLAAWGQLMTWWKPPGGHQ